MFVWLMAVVIYLVTYILYNGRNRPKGFPPGPFRLPFIGNLPQLIHCGTIERFLNKYRKIYGDLYSFEMGGKLIVVSSGYSMTHHLWVTLGKKTSIRSPRTLTKYTEERYFQYPGIIFAPEHHWPTVRSSIASILRDEGMGKRRSEDKIVEEIEIYVNHFIQPNIGKPVSTHSLRRLSSNVISQMLFDQRFDYDSKEQETLVESFHETITYLMINSITKSIPILDRLPYSTARKEKYLMDKLIVPTLEKIEEQSRHINNNGEGLVHPTQRLITLFTRDHDVGHPSLHTKKNALFAMGQLFAAGTETTSTSMRWALLYMCLYPDVQGEVHQEIDREIGLDRQIQLSDRQKLQYVEAVISETMRKSNQSATLVPRTASADIQIGNMTIPAGTQLMCNAGSVVHDEEVFPEPESFKPERFLGEDSNLMKQRLITFGLGKRKCIGESLARNEQFLIFSTLMQKFSVKLANCSQDVTDEPVQGFELAPPDYKIFFTLR